MKNIRTAWKFMLIVAIVGTNGCLMATKPSDSEQWLTFKGKSNMPHIVLISGDEEYRSEEALPQLAKILSKNHGFNCTVLFSQDPNSPGVINPNYLNNIPGLESLKTADMMVIFTRFRALPDGQMKFIDDFLKSGKPVMGMRTATHAFNFNKIDFESHFTQYSNYYKEDDVWKGGFGKLVLGENWVAHHGHHKHESTRGITAPGAEGHAILNGIKSGDIWGPTDVYTVRLPFSDDIEPIVLGEVVLRDGAFNEDDVLFGMSSTDSKLAGMAKRGDKEINLNDPMMPVAWTKSYQLPGGKEGKVFTTTMGASTDMLNEGVRRMLVNAVYWGLDQKVPKKANVKIVGDYNTTKFEFRKVDYWLEKKLKVTDLE